MNREAKYINDVFEQFKNSVVGQIERADSMAAQAE